MKKLFLLFGLLISLINLNANISIPDEFTITERYLSWSSDFDIETPTHRLGYVHKKIFTLRLQYDFYTTLDELHASARMRWFSWGAEFDVVDAQNKPIGSVCQKLFRFFPTFEIISPTAQILAFAKLNFWGTKYTLKDPVTEKEMAILSRPFFRLVDRWTARVVDKELFASKQMDPRLYILIMAFQTDRDNKHRDYAESFNKSVDVPKNKDRINAIKEKLGEEMEELECIDPSEEDFDSIDKLTEQILENTEEDSYEIALQGIEAMLPYLDEENLTIGQKNALLLLIDQKLRIIEST